MLLFYLCATILCFLPRPQGFCCDNVDRINYLDLASIHSGQRNDCVASKSLTVAADSRASMRSTQPETLLETVLEEAEEEQSLPFEDNDAESQVEDRLETIQHA